MLFGSNYPIETIMGTTEHQITVLFERLADLSEGELRAVFRDNAAKIYGLPITGGSN